MPDLRRRCCALLFALALTGCASTPPPPQGPPEWNDARRAEADALAARLRDTAPASDALVVRLAFPAGVDLDLYVTDPLLETVYYANTPSVSGGRLLADRRCGDRASGNAAAGEPAPDDAKIETVRFDAPPPGRYRVGVDFPHRCEGPDEVPYALSVEQRGVRDERTGLVRWLDFTTVAHEFDTR